MSKPTNDVVVERHVSDGWAGMGCTFRNEDGEYILVDPSNNCLAFSTEDDLTDFVRVVKEMMKGLE